MSGEAERVTAEIDALLRAEVASLGVVDDSPARGQFQRFVQRMTAELHEREMRIHALEEMAAYSTEELTRLRRNLTRQYRDVGDTLDTLRQAVSVFSDAAQQGDNEALAMARQRFNLQLSAEWFESPMDDGLDAASSVRQLQQNLVDLSRALADLVKEASTLATSRKELELAGAVQQMLVPGEGGVEVPGAVIHSWFQPAAQCGGDWWTAHPLADHRGLVVVGDVTGHGAPSAIITGAVKGACDLARMGMRGELRPNQLMRMLNRVITEAAATEYMMTGVAMLILPDTPQVVLTNAGHQVPWLIRGGAVQAIQGVREPPLGAQSAFSYTELTLPVERGDLIVALTDGITEAENEAGQQLGERAVRALCEEHAGLGGEGLRDKLREAVVRHCGNRQPADDITLVVIEIR